MDVPEQSDQDRLEASCLEQAGHIECEHGATRDQDIVGHPCSHGTPDGEWFAEDSRGLFSYNFKPWYKETHFSQVHLALDDGLRWIFKTHHRFADVLAYSHMEHLEHMVYTNAATR